MLEEGLRLYPRDHHLHYNLGVMYLHRPAARMPDAIRHFQAVLRARPLHGEALNNIAFTLLHMGRHEEAAAGLEPAIRLWKRRRGKDPWFKWVPWVTRQYKHLLEGVPIVWPRQVHGRNPPPVFLCDRCALTWA